MKRMLFIFIILSSSLSAQSFVNGYDSLEFGTSINEFITAYRGFTIGDVGKTLENVGVKGYLWYRIIDPRIDKVESIWTLFYQDKFYKADVEYSNVTTNEIINILKEYTTKYGEHDDYERGKDFLGREYSIYYWNINKNFVISARMTTISRTRIDFEITHMDPNINEIVNSKMSK